MIDVLVSNPSWASDSLYLPYIHGVLKTYADQDDDLRENVRWHRPIYRHDPPPELLDDYDLTRLDVLGLSCYTWNWYAQREIARTVKDVNPECWVVAGGPQCDYANPDFFRDNPFFDMVVKQDGEVPFRQLLRQRLEQRKSWEDIPGIFLRDGNGEPNLTESPRLLPEDELPSLSPYEAQTECFRAVLRDARSRGSEIWSLLETNRGCPYRCSFCDWGSLTFTQVRRFDEDRVRGDIRWLTENGVSGIHITDANFGMFDRDVDITEWLCEYREQHDAPRDLVYSPTKTKATHLPEIAKKFHEADLLPKACLALQHTDDDVLDAMDRKNLTQEEIDRFIAFNKDHDIPMYVQLILGCPNDTYDKWKSCLTDLMEMGIDGDYFVFNFDILPNAPAADPEYIEDWKIETTRTRVFPSNYTNPDELNKFAEKHLITSTRTFDEDDWAHMWVYTYFVKTLHNMGFTRKTALYLHYCEGVEFRQLYEGIVDTLSGKRGTLVAELHRDMLRAKKEFLGEKDVPYERTTIRELPDYPYYVDWAEWLFVKIALDLDRFYRELEQFVLDRFEVNHPRFRDLITYQKESMVHYSYDKKDGKTFIGDYDWTEYFERPRNLLNEPPARRSMRFSVNETRLGASGDVPITWDEQTGHERLENWFKSAVRWLIRRPDKLSVHRIESEPLSSFESLRRRLRRSVERFIGTGSDTNGSAPRELTSDVSSVGG